MRAVRKEAHVRKSWMGGAAVALAALVAGSFGAGQDPAREKLRTALKDTEPAGNWHYDNMTSGLLDAKKSKKPLLIVFR